MSITRAQELRREKKALAEKMLAISDKAATEKRLTTQEEKDQIRAIDADIKAHTEEIEILERQQDLAAELLGTDREAAARHAASSADADPEQTAKKAAAENYRKALDGYCRYGFDALPPEQRKVLTERRYNFKSDEVTPELRAALGTGTDVAGGYLVPPERAATMVEAQKAYGGMRKTNAEVFTTSHGRDLPFMANDDTGNEGRLLGENKAATNQTEPAFGMRTLGAYTYTSDYVLVSFQLLQDTEFDLEGYLFRKFAERIGRITERHFATGDGAAKPEGVTVGAKEGRVGATGQTTSVKDTDIQRLHHSVDPAYRENGRFMFHDDTLLATKLLRDGEGRPLWQSNLAVREPDTLDGKLYVVNNSMPVMAANAKSIVFGDFYYFKVRDVVPPIVLRLNERFAEYGQQAFLLFARHDGKLIYGANPTNASALCPIKYYQNSAS